MEAPVPLEPPALCQNVKIITIRLYVTHAIKKL